jgi:transposase InsO family protein
MDLFSRQVVGWSIDDHMRTSLCVNALQMAFWRRKQSLAYNIILIEAANTQARNTEDNEDATKYES